jgi:hypothetical protein
MRTRHPRALADRDVRNDSAVILTHTACDREIAASGWPVLRQRRGTSRRTGRSSTSDSGRRLRRKPAHVKLVASPCARRAVLGRVEPSSTSTRLDKWLWDSPEVRLKALQGNYGRWKFAFCAQANESPRKRPSSSPSPARWPCECAQFKVGRASPA